MDQDKSRGFRLEITSVEDFRTLCAIIRGESVTAEQQAQLAKRIQNLNQSRTAAQTALDNQKDT